MLILLRTRFELFFYFGRRSTYGIWVFVCNGRTCLCILLEVNYCAAPQNTNNPTKNKLRNPIFLVSLKPHDAYVYGLDAYIIFKYY